VLRSDLIDFVKRAGGWATYIDAEAVFRRLDSDKDGRLNYSEVCDFVDSSSSSGKSLIESAAPGSRNSSSPLRQSQSQEGWRSKSQAPGSRQQVNSIYGQSASPAKKEQNPDESGMGDTAGKSTHWGSPSPVKNDEDKIEHVELKPKKLDMDEELNQAEAAEESDQKKEQVEQEVEQEAEETPAAEEEPKEEEAAKEEAAP
jgi:hypothetical protein